VELGAGDGRFALSEALAHPERLVVAVDASRDAMVESSRRAARGHVANAVFVVSAAEALPGELAGIANELVVNFPFGSLLRAASGAAPQQTGRLARLLAVGGTLRLLLAASPRDAAGGAEELDPDRLVAAWATNGLQLVELRPATIADAIAAHSSWGKRLLRNRAPDRSAWQVRLARLAAADDGRLESRP
jgi:16S rRNA (adenine(1408)-N(1))-methyltransferase